MLHKKRFQDLHNELGWSGRMLILASMVVVIASFIFNAWATTNWVLPILLALAVVLFIESISLSIQHHQKEWRVILRILLLVLLALLLYT